MEPHNQRHTIKPREVRSHQYDLSQETTQVSETLEATNAGHLSAARNDRRTIRGSIANLQLKPIVHPCYPTCHTSLWDCLIETFQTAQKSLMDRGTQDT